MRAPAQSTVYLVAASPAYTHLISSCLAAFEVSPLLQKKLCSSTSLGPSSALLKAGHLLIGRASCWNPAPPTASASSAPKYLDLCNFLKLCSLISSRQERAGTYYILKLNIRDLCNEREREERDRDIHTIYILK